MTAPTDTAVVDLSLPTDDELLTAGSPDPRVEAARLAATGNPGQLGAAGRGLAEHGLAMDRAYELSRRTQQALAGGFVNDGLPVYDEAAHWAGLPAGFRDAGTRLHDAGRRLGVVADELDSAITEVRGRLQVVQADLGAWRGAWAAEVAAARGPSGLVPIERLPGLRARRSDVIAGMREAVRACGQAVAARVARYNELLADCVRLLDRHFPGGRGIGGPGAAAGPIGVRPGGALPLGAGLEGSSPAPPTPLTPGYTPTPQGPSILTNPIPGPVPVLPGYTPAPPDFGPLITPPASGLGPHRDEAAHGKRRPEPVTGPPPPNLTPEGAGRAGAFAQAKRDSGIPVTMPPTRVLPNTDRNDNIRPGRVYEFDVPIPDRGGKMRTVWIRDDAGGDAYPDDPKQNRGSHFNTMDKGHYDY